MGPELQRLAGRLTRQGARAYGRYLGRRFRDVSNVLWLHGGDLEPSYRLEETRALVAAIKEAGDRHLHSYMSEANVRFGLGSSSWTLHDEPGLDYYAVYLHQRLYPQILHDRRLAPRKPTLLVEDSFENDPDLNFTPLRLRQQVYWALLAGAAGHTYGHSHVWNFIGTRWRAALRAPGVEHLRHALRLFTARPHHQLEPDGDESLVVDGAGYFGADDYATAAVARDRSFAVVYASAPRPLTIDPRRLSGARRRATWFDPRTGDTRPAGERQDDRPWRLEPPSADDWALVLDDAGAWRAAP